MTSPARVAFPLFATLAFALFGALVVLIGASQEALARALELDLARTGLLGSSLVLGIGLGVLAAGPLVDRLPRRPLFLASALLTGFALVGVEDSMGFPRALMHALLAGVGGGLYETILNTASIERYREGSVRAMTLLHSAATVGAMLTPLAIGTLASALPPDTWVLPFRWAGAAHMALALLALAVPLGTPARTAASESAHATDRLLTPGLIALCVAAFAYIGIESTITVFAIPYATGGLGLDADRGRLAISLFWLGLLMGRLAFAMRSSRDDARPGAVAGAAAAVLLALGVGFGWSAIEWWIAGVGFSLGAIFPLLIALAGQRSPGAPGSAVGLVAGLGSLGGFAVPWATGVVGDELGISTAMGSLVLWSAAIVVATLFAESARRSARG